MQNSSSQLTGNHNASEEPEEHETAPQPEEAEENDVQEQSATLPPYPDLVKLLRITPGEMSVNYSLRWVKEQVPWSTRAFDSAVFDEYGLSVLFDYEPRMDIKLPFALIIRPTKSEAPLPDLGGVTADMGLESIAKLKAISKVEDTWIGERENKSKKVSFVSGKLNISYISSSSQGDDPFYYIRLDETYLSQGQYANMQVYGKDHAMDLLDKRIGGIKDNFSYTGMIDDGNYSFTSFTEEGEEPVGYVVDRDTGNVYDDISSGIVDNLYMINTMQILTPEEMISILKREPGNEGYEIEFDGNERGMYLLDYMKNGKLETTYKADPVSGDILENIPNRSMVDNVRETAIMYKLEPLVITYEVDPNVKDFEKAIKFTPNNVAVQAFSEIILKPKSISAPDQINSVKTHIDSNVLSETSIDGSTFKLKAKSGSFGEAAVELQSAHNGSVMKGTLRVKVILNHTKRWEK